MVREGLSLFSNLTFMGNKQVYTVSVGSSTSTGELQRYIWREIVGKLVCVGVVDTKYDIKIDRMAREGLSVLSNLTFMGKKQV